MAYVHFNPNPWRLSTDDCTVRAISCALGLDWNEAYMLLAETGREMGLMPTNPAVFWALLKQRGFTREMIPDTCPDCYTVKDFARDHPRGTYVLATDTHVLAVISGDWLDSWNSGDEVPLYFWIRTGGYRS